MRKILFLLFMTLLLGSCKMKEKIVEVPIPQIKTEIKVQNQLNIVQKVLIYIGLFSILLFLIILYKHFKK